MNRRKRTVAWAIVLAAAVAAGGAAAGEPQFRVPLRKDAPKIDGRIDPAEWKVATVISGFGRDGGKLCRRRVRGYVAATATHLVFAIRSQLPDKGELKATLDRDSLKAVFDDAVEVFVNPTPDADAQVDYQYLTNSTGYGGYQVHTLGGAEENPAWKGNWTTAHGFHDGAWHFECAVPVASMSRAGAGRKTHRGAWKLNLTRDWKHPWEWSSLSAKGGSYAFGGARFTVDPAAPAVAVRTEGDPFLADATLTLALHNPTDKPMKLSAGMALTRNRMPALRGGGETTLPPGGGKSYELKLTPDDPTTRFELAVRVASANGKDVFYDRTTSWPRGEAYRYVVGEKAERPPIALRFAYYPYRNRMRVLADVNGLDEDAKLTRLTAEVRPRLGGEAVRRAAFDVNAFTDGRQEIAFDLPPLDGLYEIALLGEGPGVPDEEVVEGFERKVFPWEHTPAGRSTKVYPPFTPIEVDEKRRTLGTVLREHTLGGTGLWDQVTGTSAHTGITKPILAAPMRYVVRAGGKAAEVQAEPLKIAAAAEHRAVTEASFSAGPAEFSSRGTWDYDGTMKVELTIQPTGGAKLEELTLEVPFRAEAAALIHANADRIRAPVARKVPEGEGVVWDAGKVASDEMPAGFCPYVFVGDAVRGLCWFADNDLNWSRDAETPNVTLVRRGGRVVLRVHFVNVPVAVTEPRTITFGLLAAPVKPRLVAPGEGKHWWRYRYLRDNYTLLGTDINWLARGSCGSVYPAAKDMYLWEMISRGNREKLGREAVQEVVEHTKRYFADYPGRVKSWVAHVNHNLRSRYGKRMVFYYNRASCQLFDEFETFKDEWCLTDYRSIPKGNGLGEIKIVPAESYIDHAIYWYARSFEVGNNKGVYWDNFFIAPSFNTAMTDAYRRPDGRVTPAAGIWALRELARRTFVMMNERGMLPITFPHMTSFNPLPMMAFCTVQYDWEWKYSLGDVQDRHDRDLILLMSTGELAGTWPVPLGDHGKLSRDAWTQRTFTAVRLVHELDGYGGFGLSYADSHAANRKLFEPIARLLDEPKLDVWRYWDERPVPVRATRDDVPTIVYAVPGREAVVAATSYAKEDVDATLKVDLEPLGLSGRCTVTDVETGKPMELTGGELRFPLKKHDVKVLRLVKE